MGILIDAEPRRMLPVGEEHLTLDIHLRSSGVHTVRLIKMTELLDDISLFLEGVYLDDQAAFFPRRPCRPAVWSSSGILSPAASAI